MSGVAFTDTQEIGACLAILGIMLLGVAFFTWAPLLAVGAALYIAGMCSIVCGADRSSPEHCGEE